MLNVLFSTFELLIFHALITIVDRVTRLPRHSTPPELMRPYRENIALKSQLRALVLELKAAEGNKPSVSVPTRAAQVLAYLLTSTANGVQTRPWAGVPHRSTPMRRRPQLS